MQYTSLSNTTTVLDREESDQGDHQGRPHMSSSVGTQIVGDVPFPPATVALVGVPLDNPYALVIDDDDAILSVVLLLLEIEEYAGVGLSDSTKVLPFLEQLDTKHLPTVILLDLMMPVMTGHEIAAHVSGHPRYAHIPIVIMTADSRVHSASVVPGAIDWISKPFQMTDLLTKLEHYLLASSM